MKIQTDMEMRKRPSDTDELMYRRELLNCQETLRQLLVYNTLNFQTITFFLILYFIPPLVISYKLFRPYFRDFHYSLTGAI